MQLLVQSLWWQKMDGWKKKQRDAAEDHLISITGLVVWHQALEFPLSVSEDGRRGAQRGPGGPENSAADDCFWKKPMNGHVMDEVWKAIFLE